ncbi:sugar porter family MFS transporter [Sphingomonas oryzagri]
MRQSATSYAGFIALISGVATIGGFLFGFDSGVINGTVEGLQQAFHTSSAGTGFNVASVLLGSAVGAFAAGSLADVYGRRSILIVSAVLFFLSAIGAGAANGSAMFVVARLIGGFAVGAASVLSPAYVAEVTPAATRGKLSTLQQIMINVGLLGSFISNALLAHFAGSAMHPLWAGLEAWRWMFWMQTIPSAVFFFALLTIPESPRYLVARGRGQEAHAVLDKIMGDAEARRKIGEIEASLNRDHKPSLADLKDPTTGKIRRVVWAGVGIAAFQQLVGINVIFYYGSVLWQSIGYTEAASLGFNILTGVLAVISCLISSNLVDRVGRKPLLLVGSAGMAVMLVIVAIALSTGTTDAHNKMTLGYTPGMIAVVSVYIYSIFFNLSWGPVVWVMLGEMFPNQVRGSALAVSGLSQWVANFAITMTFPILLGSIGLVGAYAVYAFFAAVSIPFVAKLVHETKGVELEAMQG